MTTSLPARDTPAGRKSQIFHWGPRLNPHNYCTHSMDAARSKLIVKRKGNTVVEPSAFDLTAAKALVELQNASQSEIAAELANLQIYGAREVELTAGRKAVVIVVPVPQLKQWRRIQSRVTRELEKKFSDKQVVIVAFRRILAKNVTRKQQRPASRTVKAVHEAWLEDMVYPTEIVGKRIRVKTDGSRLVKVLLDPKDQSVMESKVEGFAAVYRNLTGQDVAFEFPVLSAEESRK